MGQRGGGDGGKMERNSNPLTFFSLFLDDLIIEGIDAPKCLRVDLVQDEYRRGRRRGFAILAVLVVEDERRHEGCIVVERVRKEAFSRRWLLVKKSSRVSAPNLRRLEETISK
jgi:hypothetical protein